jgi:hypothetical protein
LKRLGLFARFDNTVSGGAGDNPLLRAFLAKEDRGWLNSKNPDGIDSDYLAINHASPEVCISATYHIRLRGGKAALVGDDWLSRDGEIRGLGGPHQTSGRIRKRKY